MSRIIIQLLLLVFGPLIIFSITKILCVQSDIIINKSIVAFFVVMWAIWSMIWVIGAACFIPSENDKDDERWGKED